MFVCPVDFTPILFEESKVCVMQDYYSEDGVRTPLTYNEAIAIAFANGWGLPTKEQVDRIWEMADCKLDPIPMWPNRGMEEYERHDALINEQIHHSEKDCHLVAGHKKDVLRTSAIYGWHRLNGDPIQPIFYGHGWDYADYSHGVRFIIEEPNE